jgi:hypothetical protein
MRNHSPFLLQTNKQNNMSKNLKQNKMDIKTYIPNQQKSSFTIYRKFIVDIVNETIEYKNKSINNESEKLSLMSYDEIKSRDELYFFIKENNLQKIGVQWKQNKSKRK